MVDVVYEIMPALKEVHEAIGLAVMQNSSADAMRAIHLVREDFLREHRKSGISPRDYADAKRLCMVDYAATYLEGGLGIGEAEWLGLEFHFPTSPAYKEGVYQMVKKRLFNFGKIVPDPRNWDYMRIRVLDNCKSTHEDYLLNDNPTFHSIYLRVWDSQENIPIEGPLPLEVKILSP